MISFFFANYVSLSHIHECVQIVKYSYFCIVKIVSSELEVGAFAVIPVFFFFMSIYKDFKMHVDKRK